MEVLAKSRFFVFSSHLLVMRGEEIEPQRLAQQLDQQGLSEMDIGQILHTDPRQIRSWLRGEI